jgi:cbb3-type cytochrome oxidase subunit 3
MTEDQFHEVMHALATISVGGAVSAFAICLMLFFVGMCVMALRKRDK